MSKLIAHEYLKEFIFHDMALKNQSAEGLEILSLNRILNSSENESDTVMILKLAKQMKKEQDRFPDYHRMLSFPSFYQEILSFVKQLALWGLDAEALPDEDDSEMQLRDIVRTALSLDLAEKKIRQDLDSSVEKAVSEGYAFVDGFENSCFQRAVLNRMEALGMEKISYWNHNPQTIVRKRALSTRMEIEGCAQYICRNQKPCTIVLCNPSSALPVLRQVFDRYGIPYSYTVSKRNQAIGKAFSALAQFSVYKDSAHLIRAIETQAFCKPCEDSLLDFLAQVLNDVKAPCRAEDYAAAYARAQSSKYDPDKAFQRDPVTIYRRLEERAQKYFAEIQSAVDSLNECEDPKEKLIRCYEIIKDSCLLADREETAAGRRILSQLQDCIDLIESDEEVLFFASMMEDISVSSHRLVSDFCTVTDLTHPVLPKENTYVIGCSGKDYPGFRPLSGVFDETYVRRIEGFPSLEERQTAYLSDLSWIMRSCQDELIFSASTNDHQGRELIGAFELEELPDGGRWELDYYDEKRNYEHVISKESAEQLFLKEEDGERFVSGSISSIESWFRCPYRYFLASGLYVRKPQTPDLSADSVGTWQHAAMEKAVYDASGEPDPDYASKLDEEKIRELISPYFDALRIANPNDTVRISLSEERMVASLKKAVSFLAEYEKSTTFIPYETEKNFRRFPVSPNVRINGTIDRVSKDPRNHMIAILDYKSSSKTLSPASVKAGQQLQLLTYLCAAMDLYGQQEEIIPAGTYYFSLSAANISEAKDIAAASVNRASWKLSENDFRNDEEQMKALMMKKRQLSGWTFTDRKDAVDSEGKYVSGLKKTYRYESVRECLYVLYEYFYNRLIAQEENALPDISVDPVDNACTYCDYRGICRYHGNTRKPQEIYEDSLEERKK